METNKKSPGFTVGPVPTVMYIPDFIDETEQTQILNHIYQAPVSKWKTLKNRRLQNWGGVVHEKGLISQNLPSWLTKLNQRLYGELGIFPAAPNHVLINEYLPDQGIMPHQDGPAYFPAAAILSLESPVVMNFTPHVKLSESNDITEVQDTSQNQRNNQGDSPQNFSLLLMPRSLLIFKDLAYSDYLHGIEDNVVQRYDKAVNQAQAKVDDKFNDLVPSFKQTGEIVGSEDAKPTWEGGNYAGDESMRQNILIKAMELGADYIDIELKVADEFIESISEREYEKTKIIVSYHNYESTPSSEELGGLLARIQATGAHLVKIVTTALDITDCAHLFQVFPHSQVPVIGVAMGEKGLISRILSAKFGGFLTFASIDGSAEIASGEPTITDLLNLYNFRCIGADTKVHGVIGNPIGHSKSPHLYNAAFKSVGFNGVYLPLLVDSVPKFLNTFSSPDFVGYSFTIPHKLAELECCDEVDPIAKEIGAISCMIKRPWDGKLIGYNIDYLGAVAAIEAGLRGSNGRYPVSGSPLAGRLLVIIGAGGAGKALAYCGASNGAGVVISDCVPGKFSLQIHSESTI